MEIAATSPSFLLAALGMVTSGERGGAKTRVRGIDLAAGVGAWAFGFQAYEGTREKSSATREPWWAASSFGFTGREHELDSGLVYARARYLQPGTGHWDRPDPLGQAAGPNYYAYVDADPVGRADPTGYMGLPNPVPPPLWPPAANEPMRRRGIVLDTVSAYAMAHTAAFMWLLYDLGEISEEVWKKIQRQCDDNNDSLEEFWRGDSYERAAVSVTTGFLSAGIGIEAGQLGPGLYMSRERPVAVRYADRRKAEFGRGAVIDILVRTSIWKAVLSLGAVDGLPIAGDVGTQAFVPTGMALGLFDAQSWKMIHEVR